VRAAGEFAGPGIVYAATHASAQAAHDTLASEGERVTLYHAGLSGRERHDAMSAFLDGSARIITATVAFGMGIDKPDGQQPGPGARLQTAALARLADLGAAAWQADGEIRWTAAMSPAEAVQASQAQTEREDEVERTRLTMMRRYADHAGCRRSFLLTEDDRPPVKFVTDI
jgi:hypothetical protein